MTDVCLAPAALSIFQNTPALRVLPQDEPLWSDLKFADIVSYTLSLLDQLLIFAVTAGMTWKCFQLKLVKTATHAFLCTLGFVCLLAEGLMIRYRGNVFVVSMSMSAATKLNTHLILQVLGGTLGILGTIQKVVGKNKHFHTLHGKLGLAACIFCFMNFFAGLSVFFPDLYNTKFTLLVTTFVHNFLGLVTFVTAILAQYYGYETGFFRRNFESKMSIYKTLTALILVLTVLGPFKLLILKTYRIIGYIK